jgi:hypothetical protein
MERGWRVGACGKQVTRGVEYSPVELDMFIIDNDNMYTCLQVPISILKTIQTTPTIGGVQVTPTNLVDVVANGMDNDSDDPHGSNEDV